MTYPMKLTMEEYQRVLRSRAVANAGADADAFPHLEKPAAAPEVEAPPDVSAASGGGDDDDGPSPGDTHGEDDNHSSDGCDPVDYDTDTNHAGEEDEEGECKDSAQPKANPIPAMLGTDEPPCKSSQDASPPDPMEVDGESPVRLVLGGEVVSGEPPAKLKATPKSKPPGFDYQRECLPWWVTDSEITRRRGAVATGGATRLYDCSTIVDDDYVRRRRFTAVKRERFYIDLFCENRFYKAKHVRTGDDESQQNNALAQAWHQFVQNYNSDQGAWIATLRSNRDKYERHSYRGRALRLHRLCATYDIPCGVASDCPACLRGARKLTTDQLKGYDNTYHIPSEIAALAHELDVHVPTVDARKHQQDQGRPPTGQSVAPTSHTLGGTPAIGRGTPFDVGHAVGGSYGPTAYPQSSVGLPGCPPAAPVAVVGPMELVQLQNEILSLKNSILEARDAREKDRKWIDYHSRCFEWASPLIQGLQKELIGLRKEHDALVVDHKRVLGHLRANDLLTKPDPARKRRHSDADGTA